MSKGSQRVGGYFLKDGEVLRISADEVVFFVDDEQKYREAMSYIESRCTQLNLIEVVSLQELI